MRLAILDMDLGESGSSESAMASAVVKRLERIIHPDNGPYVALIWTNRPTVMDEFEKYVFQSSVPNPVITVMITKAEVKDKQGTKFLISKIAKRVDDELASVGPFQALQGWEEVNFNATAAVTTALSQLVTPTSPDLPGWRAAWKRQLNELLRAMAEATAGKHLQESSCIPSIYASLNPLHFDRLGKNIEETAKHVRRHGAEIMAAKPEPGAERKARINSMMHLDFHPPAGLHAGNLYFFTAAKRPAWVPKPADILEGFLKQNINADDLLNNSIPVLVEISAICDHAQKKIKMARLLAGLATPSNLRNRFVDSKAVSREGTAIWQLGPLDLSDANLQAPQYYLQFNARYITSLTLKQVGQLKARARFRSEALAHVQTWFAFQSSRPGMVLMMER